MKKLSVYKLQMALLMALMPMMAAAQEKIMVIADPHVLARELRDPESQSCKDMMKSQRKMLDLSDTAWCALMDTALKYKPALLLIPGDLTKDSEKASHNKVVSSLKQLHAAGIKTLVIPGNHDIGGSAYAYLGDTKASVEALKNDEWETTYDWVYENAAKDPDSHSFAAEPLDGMTVLGIDGSNNSAGTGELSDATVNWLLGQADAAVAKGNMIIAMAHWQILEHFDKQGSLESSCRFKNADILRDQLMHRGVHLVLTGHFHVDGITTFRDTTGLTTDSIVEITTGSPITYPCPYRWLTLSKDRATVSVETETITALDTISDMYTYSREWMKEHTANMIPVMAERLWSRFDSEKLKELATNELGIGEPFVTQLINLLPSDDEKTTLVQKHMGSTIIDLYLLHSDANEPEHPEGETLKQEVYTGIENMIDEVLSKKPLVQMALHSAQVDKMLVNYAKDMVNEPMNSLVGDVTHWKSAKYADLTDDLHLMLTINEARETTGIEELPESTQHSEIMYDLFGRPVSQPMKGHIYIQEGKKILY